MNNKSKIIAAASCMALAAVVSFAVSDNWLKTTEYELNTDKPGEEICIAVLSDMHFASFGKDNSRLLSAVKKINPDVIFVVGDFFDIHNGKTNEEKAFKTLGSLCEIADVWFAPGNHEFRFDNATGKNSCELASSAGCKVVNGNYFDTVIKNRQVRIGGIFDIRSRNDDYKNNGDSSDVKKFLGDFEQTAGTTLLLMHRPNTFIYTDDKYDIDAVFCGHTHGGIWQMPFVGGILAPEQGFFPKYDKGEFDFGKTKMFLCGGLEGYNLFPRLFNRPEILKVIIK